MSDNEVRIAVQRALDKLINRFGQPSEVIGELRAALAAMDKQEAKAAAVETPPAADTKTEFREERDKAEAKAEPPPETPRKRSMGRKK